MDSDCCCDPAAVVGADAPQLPKPIPLIAPSIDVDLLTPMLARGVGHRLQMPAMRQTSPPVYLATQRLRI